MVTLADKNMLPHLITLWQKSFGDSAEYIRMFLDWNFDRIQTIVYVTDDDTALPVSVAYLLPVTLAGKGKQDIPCWYLYAAATLPEYRGHGYFAKILKFVEQMFPEPMILVPGEKSLISYYEKQGMHVWLQERKWCMRQETACSVVHPSINVLEISPEEYCSMRKRLLSEAYAFQKEGYMFWDEPLLQYICQENKYCGGYIKQITFENETALVMYRVENGMLKVLELLPQTQVKACLNGLIAAVNDQLLSEGYMQTCKAAEVLLQPTVMANSKLDVIKDKGYFNLIMA